MKEATELSLYLASYAEGGAHFGIARNEWQAAIGPLEIYYCTSSGLKVATYKLRFLGPGYARFWF